jgi:ribosome-binding protein aMBF1 (putative translation factor)
VDAGGRDRPQVISAAAIGAEIRRARMARGWPIEQLAHRAGVATNTVGYIERGERDAGFLTVQCVLVAVGLRLTCCVAEPIATGPDSPGETLRPI